MKCFANVIYSGTAQSNLEELLDQNCIPPEVRECKFYYQCLMSAWKWRQHAGDNRGAIVGEFKFLRFLMSEDGKKVKLFFGAISDFLQK